MLQTGRSLFKFLMRSMNFLQLAQSFQLHYGPGVYSASNMSIRDLPEVKRGRTMDNVQNCDSYIASSQTYRYVMCLYE
jgi:hypothetical protein